MHLEVPCTIINSNVIVKNTKTVSENELDPETETDELVERVNYEASIAFKGFTKAGNSRKRRKVDVAEKQAEIEKKVIKKHLMLLLYGIKLCIEVMPEDQRKIINSGRCYKRKAFILYKCSRLNVKHRTGESNKKQNSFKYTLDDKKSKATKVCKTFFLTILDLKKPTIGFYMIL